MSHTSRTVIWVDDLTVNMTNLHYSSFTFYQIYRTSVRAFVSHPLFGVLLSFRILEFRRSLDHTARTILTERFRFLFNDMKRSGC